MWGDLGRAWRGGGQRGDEGLHLFSLLLVSVAMEERSIEETWHHMHTRMCMYIIIYMQIFYFVL